MSQVFEDEFMDVQSELISLCLELVGQTVDEIYAYCSIEKDGQSFNAFFVVNNEVKTLGKLNLNKMLTMRFLSTGTMDLNKVRRVCEKYNMPVPTEIKMSYIVSTGKFGSQYKYDEICSGNTDKTARDVFMEWVSEVKLSLAGNE